MIRKIWKKRQERIDNWLSELNTFQEVYKRSRWISELSWEYVYEPRTRCFAHILPKWTYPKLRNNPNNIIFVKNIKEHELVDHFVAHNKKVFFDLVESWTAIQKLRYDFLQYNKNNHE
jgi:hypothetical protein